MCISHTHPTGPSPLGTLLLSNFCGFFAPVLKAESSVRPNLVKTGGFVLLEFIVPVARRTCDTVRMGYTKTPMCHGDLEHGLADYAPVHV